jgi:hypothetical protein
MANAQARCTLPLPDGSPCRRAARYVCRHWHLSCGWHGPYAAPDPGTREDHCAGCGEAVIRVRRVDVAPLVERRRAAGASAATIVSRLVERCARAFRVRAED